MRALVTGATGFIGYHLARALRADGHEVVCLVRRTSNTRYLEALGGVSFRIGDLGDRNSLVSAVRGFEWVFHLAGAVIAVDRAGYFRVNAEGTRNLASAAAEADGTLQKFVYVSSLAAGGPTEPDGLRSERFPDNPVTVYGQSKLAAERCLESMAGRIPVTILRPPTVYGPHDVALLPFFRAAANGVGIRFAGRDLRLSLLYVEDLARALIEAARHPGSTGERFYVTDGQGAYSMRSIQEQIAAVYGKRLLALPVPRLVAPPVGWLGEAIVQATGRPAFFNRDKVKEMLQPSWSCESAKLTHVVGYRPRYPLPEGARRTAVWYRKQGWIRR